MFIRIRSNENAQSLPLSENFSYPFAAFQLDFIPHLTKNSPSLFHASGCVLRSSEEAPYADPPKPCSPREN